ncbi:MAG: hypothetical protein JST59_01265 [Actinobacteria bacterium]|nr:hypothetical protein [Actinomycetota bacterium]
MGYYDIETAQMAVNFLGETDFRGRELRINFKDSDRSNRVAKQSADEQIYEDLERLPQEERLKLIQLVAKYARTEPDFAEFLSHHEKIEEGLRRMTAVKRQQPHLSNHY